MASTPRTSGTALAQLNTSSKLQARERVQKFIALRDLTLSFSFNNSPHQVLLLPRFEHTMLGNLGKYIFHYHGNYASADRRLQVRDSAASLTASAQPTAPNSTVQHIGTGGGSSATPSNNPTSAANARPRGPTPPPYPASGFDAYAQFHSNGRDANSTHGPPLNRLPGAPSSSGMTSSGPVSRKVPPAPASMQQEVPDRHGSAPASHADNSAATKRRKRNGLGILMAAQNTSGPAAARASSLPATSQVQTGTGSAEGGLQAAQLRAAGANIGPNEIPHFAPSQAQPPITSAGAGDSSSSTTSQAQPTTTTAPANVGTSSSLATSQTQTRVGHVRPGVPRRPAASRPIFSAGGGQDELQAPRWNNAAAARGRSAAGLRAFLQAEARNGSAGAGSSSRAATPQAQSMAASAEPGSSRDTAIVIDSQAMSMTAPAGLGVSSIPVIQQSAATPAAGGVNVSTPVTGDDGGGALSPPLVTDTPQDESLTASAGPVPTIPINPQAVSAPATYGGVAPTLPANLQATSTTAPAVLDVPTNPQSAATPANACDGGGVSCPPPVIHTSQDQSLTAGAGAGASAVSANPQAVSTPATGGGGDLSFPIVPPVESMTGSGNDDVSSPTATLQAQSTAAPAGADVPSLPVNPQSASVAATGRGGASSFSVVPQRASTTGAGSDNSDKSSSKKRKRAEKQPKDSKGHTKK